MAHTLAPDFTFDTSSSQNLRLSTVVKDSDYTFLIFLRYYGCTSCQIDLIDLTAHYAAFREKNAQLLVVLQSDPRILAAGVEDRGIPFTLISDPEQKIYPLYQVKPAMDYDGLRQGMTEAEAARYAAKRAKAQELNVQHGEYEGNEYQLPAYFLLDRNMQILLEHRARNIADMPRAEEYLESLSQAVHADQ